MRSIFFAALLAAFLTACDSNSNSAAPSNASATANTASASISTVASPSDTKSDEPDEATKLKCQRIGSLAYKIAAARNAGVAAETTFSETINDPDNEVDPPTVIALEKQLYIGFAKQMTPEGAGKAYYVDCLVTADSKSIDGQSNIAAALAPFKTYTGEPLQKVLARQHIKVESITVSAVKTLREGDQKGDEIYSLSLRGRPPKTAPCDLHNFSQVDENESEIIRRGSGFREEKPTDLDLVMYWAATGKCNPEY
ncbi:hypothetical protein PQQ72_31640 [Paraburkholderia strydomiana]|uniref:hypothetical protein n=1 Tax=Paraburkholderia strydomiana TaxID=1245417 RepID=UPI0038BB7D29